MIEDAQRRWASCGATWLTGDPDGPPLTPLSPAAVVADGLARPFGLDAGVLTERAAMLGLHRGGRVSCGGSTRLLRSSDGWVALALPRPSDVAVLPALLGAPIPASDDVWAAVAGAVRGLPGSVLEETASLLGVACSVVGSEGPIAPVRISGEPRTGAVAPSHPLVVTLAALWAGPLCAHLLGRLGARVVKVEDPRRPDGTRRAPAAWRDLLLAGQDTVAVNLGTPSGRGDLVRLLEAADVIVTSSRARAMEQLGIDPFAILSASSDKVWVAVTGYGWESRRVGFGDDAAAAAGLVAWHPGDGEPRFAGDAVADPMCGLFAADTARTALAAGGRWFADVPLAAAAAAVAPSPGPAVAAVCEHDGWRLDGVSLSRPVGRRPGGVARPLGADTSAVFESVVCRRRPDRGSPPGS